MSVRRVPFKNLVETNLKGGPFQNFILVSTPSELRSLQLLLEDCGPLDEVVDLTKEMLIALPFQVAELFETEEALDFFFLDTQQQQTSNSCYLATFERREGKYIRLQI